LDETSTEDQRRDYLQIRLDKNDPAYTPLRDSDVKHVYTFPQTQSAVWASRSAMRLKSMQYIPVDDLEGMKSASLAGTGFRRYEILRKGLEIIIGDGLHAILDPGWVHSVCVAVNRICLVSHLFAGKWRRADLFCSGWFKQLYDSFKKYKDSYNHQVRDGLQLTADYVGGARRDPNLMASPHLKDVGQSRWARQVHEFIEFVDGQTVDTIKKAGLLKINAEQIFSEERAWSISSRTTGWLQRPSRRGKPHACRRSKPQA
jgi:hypothetical protein